MRKRIIVSFPTHPFYFMFYMVLLIPLSLIAPSVFSFLTVLFGFNFRIAVVLGFMIFLLSLLLSPINIVLKEYMAGGYTIGFQQRYVFFFGIPIPIITPVIVARKVVLAINVGGALIPLTISLILLYELLLIRLEFFTIALLAIITTTFISYLSARAIPGAGIAVPGLVPPLTSVITTILFVDDPTYSVPIAYIGGVLGSLVGADVLRLKKELHKFINVYGSSFLSIGGAGTFDGVYLSGILAAALAIILI